MGSPSSDGVVASPSCGQWLTSSGKQRLQAGHSFIYRLGTTRNDGKKDSATTNWQTWQPRVDSNGSGGEQATDKTPSSNALRPKETLFLKSRRLSWDLASLSHYDIHQPLWHDDDFDNLVPLNQAANLLILKGCVAKVVFSNLGRN